MVALTFEMHWPRRLDDGECPFKSERERHFSATVAGRCEHSIIGIVTRQSSFVSKRLEVAVSQAFEWSCPCSLSQSN